jgi:hypothetical protein
MHQPSEVTTEPAAPVKIVARRVATQPRSQRIPEGHEPTGAYTHEDVNAVLWFGRKAGLRIECLSFAGCKSRSEQSRFVCEFGDQWFARAHGVVVRGFGCPDCYHRLRAVTNRLSTEEVNARPLMVKKGYVCISDKPKRPRHRKFKCKFGFRFEGPLSDVLNGHKSCPCKKCKALRSQKQSIDQINRRLAPLKLKCTEYNGAGGDSLTSSLECLVCENSYDAYAVHVLRGLSGCKACKGAKIAERSRQRVVEALKKQGFGISLVTYGGTQRAVSWFNCCGQEWPDHARSVLRRKIGCPHRARNSPLTLDIVNARLAVRDRKIICIAYGGSSAAFSEFECEVCCCRWSQTATHVVSDGSGCPDCNPGGFDYMAPAIFYLLLGGDGRINIGVTRDPIVRIATHEDEDAIPYIALIIQSFAVGIFAVVAEDIFKLLVKTAGIDPILGTSEEFRIRATTALEIAYAAIEFAHVTQTQVVADLGGRSAGTSALVGAWQRPAVTAQSTEAM